ncbi:MAG: hypothetical protein KJO32_04265 [Deltaproteobacteria bacterium]|nr:hypothetical protein [Deltaproteobacteria bacterium]
MQQRRREEIEDRDRTQASLLLPHEHWQILRRRNPKTLEHLCVPDSEEKELLSIRLLDRMVRISSQREQVEERVKEHDNYLWRPAGSLASRWLFSTWFRRNGSA